MADSEASAQPDWKQHGVRIIRSGELDTNTPQTPGMTRAEAISHARVGARKLWAGTVVVHPNAKTGPHHHGELETVIYIVRGRARFRWGDHLDQSPTHSIPRRENPSRRSFQKTRRMMYRFATSCNPGTGSHHLPFHAR